MTPRLYWPNLFIVGAPRCGTTALHDVLSRHSDIFMSDIKEPHFFSSYAFPRIEKRILSITTDERDYLRLFEKAARERIRGESSSYYLADPEAAVKIRSRCPDAKVIVLLRDPVERAWSHYLLYGRRGRQTMSFSQTVKAQIEHPEEISPVYNLVELGCYGRQLERYFACFGPERVKVLLFSELTGGAQACDDILDFLGVAPDSTVRLLRERPRNMYAAPRNRLTSMLLGNEQLATLALLVLPRRIVRAVRSSMLRHGGEKPEVEAEAKERLIDVYQGEVDHVSRLLGRDVSALRASWT